MSERRPAIYIPTLYFAEGLPYTIVMMMSSVFFKSLGADNIFIGLATILSLPWSLKFLWAPLVDMTYTKRSWIVISQLVLAVVCAALILSPFSPDPIWFSVAIFGVMALASATHDIAIDGYYLDVLNKDQQAFYVGVRNAFYKVAWLFASGGMVCLAGAIEKQTGDLKLGWSIAFGILAVSLLACFLFHSFYLPASRSAGALSDVQSNVQQKEVVSTAVADSGNRSSRSTSSDPAGGAGPSGPASGAPSSPEPAGAVKFVTAIFSYFNQPGALAIAFYILTFRMGDAFLMKQVGNFLLDPAAKGGMGISVQDIGMICGTVGVVALLVGGLLGGWLVSKQGLRRWFVPAALIQNSALLLYWLVALTKPRMEWLYLVNTLEHLAYGLGMTAYMVFLLRTVRSEYKAAHYATATGLMTIGMLVPGMCSGYLVESLGYANFFLISFFLSLPGMISIFFLPLWRDEVPAK